MSSVECYLGSDGEKMQNGTQGEGKAEVQSRDPSIRRDCSPGGMEMGSLPPVEGNLISGTSMAVMTPLENIECSCLRLESCEKKEAKKKKQPQQEVNECSQSLT